MMNLKKYNIKQQAACFFFMLTLMGCTQTPKKVNGQPVKVVDSMLLHPLEINTDKEQQLYFRFRSQPDPKEDSYIISAVAIIPDEYETPDFFLNDILIKEKKMSFELELTHYGKDGKAQPVGLRSYSKIGTTLDDKSSVTSKKQFEGVRSSYFWYGIPNGYNGRANGLAYFNSPAKGGYYHLTIRALQDYSNYPKMKLAVKISPVVFK